MTLRTALIIDGDSAGGKKALDELNESIAKSEQLSEALSKAYADADVQVTRLAQAQATTKTQTDAAKAALQAGEITQVEYNRTLLEAKTALGLVETEYRSSVTALKQQQAAAEQAGAGHEKMGGSVGQSRIALMELQHVARGTTDQIAAGAPISQVFASHMGMIGEAAGLAGGSLGKFGEFMAGPYGVAVTVAISLGTMLIAKLLDTSNAVEDETGKLKKNAIESAAADQAHKAWAGTLDGVSDALRKNKQALDGIIEGERSAAEKALAAAIAAKARLDIIDTTTRSLIQQAKAQIELNNAQAMGPETKGHVDPHLVAADAARDRLTALEATLPELKNKLDDAQQQIDQATAAVYAQAAGKDPVQRIKDEAQAAVDAATRKATISAAAARAAGDEAKAQRLITTELQKQVRAINDKRDADVKAYQDAHKSGPANAGGTAIANAQTAAFFDIANRYRGQSETANRTSLKDFLGGVDPEKTAWCAAFVNAVLSAGGVKGTVTASGAPNLAARSFLNYGQNDMASPQKGDIVILKGAAGEHVGFLDSIDKAGNVRVLAGNTGNKVAEATYSKSQVLAIRRPPSPSEEAAAEAKADQQQQRAEQQARQQKGTFDTELARLNQQYLVAEAKVTMGAEASAEIQLRRAQAEHDAEAQSIATNLAEGKYGAATGDLAKSRAAQLVAANDNLLKEQQAAIGLEGYVKWLQATDAAAERNSRFQLDGLQYQESIAKTAGERRALALEIIDLEYQEKKQHLEYLLQLAKLTGNTKDAADIAAQLANLPAEKARDTDKAKRDTRGPLDEWASTIPQGAKEIGEALENDAVKGINDFNDGLADAIVHGKSLKDVFHSLAESMLQDLIKLALQEAELYALKAIFGSFGGGRAAGGPVDAGTPYLVGERGMEIFVPTSNGTIIPNHQLKTATMRAAANDSGPSMSITIPISNDFRGAAPEAVAQLSAKLDQLQRDLPSTILSTMADARSRFVWR